LPTGNFFAKNAGAYATAPNASMAPETITNAGGSQPHTNMGPYLVISFAMALIGVFPSRN
jgi:microcystin-dependent protein